MNHLPDLRGVQAVLLQDDVDVREPVATFLRISNAVVLIAEDIERACRHFEARAPQAIIVDLAVIGALEAPRQVRGTHPDSPIAMIAMSTSPKDHGHAKNAGFDAFVRKGDLQQLSATLKYVADCSAWRRPLAPRLSGDCGTRI
jgi:DNA-binding response OmpR family regulator